MSYLYGGFGSQIERVDGPSQGTDGMQCHLNSYLGERSLRGSIFLLGNVFLLKNFLYVRFFHLEKMIQVRKTIPFIWFS